MPSKRKSTPASRAVVAGNVDDEHYDSFLQRVNARFLANVKDGAEPLFTTDVDGLYDAYLASFKSKAERQHHTCSCCRHFIERFGGLVTINDLGSTAPAIWNEEDAPDHYKPAVKAMARLVRKAKVTGVFLSSDSVWGSPQTGAWRHLSVRPSPVMKFHRATQSAGQAMAEKREDFITVNRALAEFSAEHVEVAMNLLKSDALYRSEKVLGQAEWLLWLHRGVAASNHRSNVVWKAVAKAPAGFCHPRSSMIGTLLEDIAAGMDFSQLSRRFAEKMHPLQYQRPSAPPSEGNIAAAEKIVAQLGAAGALSRRYARLDEVQALWRPAAPKQANPAGGVFGHLKSNAAKARQIEAPEQVMTWVKFSSTVLPTADRIEILVPNHGSFITLVTATNFDAPPILQWDRPEARNPVSWYLWTSGSMASQHGLDGGSFANVAAVTLKPSMWTGEFAHQGKDALFLIEGAKETRNAGSCLFPEILKSEFHGIRSVLEAHSRASRLEGDGSQTATGLGLPVSLRVWSGGHVSCYRLDRWD